MNSIIPHDGSVNALAFSPDGKLLASGAEDSWVKVWRLSEWGSEQPLWEAESPHRVVAHAQFTPDSRELFTSGADQCLRVWDAKTGRELRASDPDDMPYGVDYVGAFVIAPDGRHVAWGGGNMSMPSDVAVTETAHMKMVRQLAGHLAAVGIFASLGDLFVSGSADRTVRFWNWGGTECLHTLPMRGVVRGLAATRDGRHLATSGGAVINLHAIETPLRVGEPVAMRGHKKQVQCLDFSPDCRLLASASLDSTVRVWDVATARETRRFDPGNGPLHWVAFSPDNRTLAFSSRKGHIGLLDFDE